MRLKSLMLAASAFCATVALSTTASAAGVFGVTYFEVPSNFGGDFGICCNSPPATSVVISLGAALGPNGMPVAETGSTAVDVNGTTHEVGWWTVGSGITATGTGTLPLPLPLTNMFAPNSTGSNNSSFFETALLHGVFTGSGAPAQLTVSSDDDAYVYLDGLYIGGNPGVHGTATAVLNLGSLTGNHSLDVFYADRAQVAASLGVSGINLDTLRPGVPEPATWSLMILGFGAAGAMLRKARKLATA